MRPGPMLQKYFTKYVRPTPTRYTLSMLPIFYDCWDADRFPPHFLQNRASHVNGPMQELGQCCLTAVISRDLHRSKDLKLNTDLMPLTESHWPFIMLDKVWPWRYRGFWKVPIIDSDLEVYRNRLKRLQVLHACTAGCLYSKGIKFNDNLCNWQFSILFDCFIT